MTTMHQDRKIAAPDIQPGLEPFWDAAKKGELLISHCNDCGEYIWYPRPICPHCFAENTAWHKASGLGKIYSVTVTRRAGPIPFALAYVTLDEGVTMLTNIVDCDLDALRIG
ncbi:MAG: Zn-ribbon domain-containing OB-fold protein, partial [Janthinobacterium lividum]